MYFFERRSEKKVSDTAGQLEMIESLRYFMDQCSGEPQALKILSALKRNSENDGKDSAGQVRSTISNGSVVTRCIQNILTLYWHISKSTMCFQTLNHTCALRIIVHSCSVMRGTIPNLTLADV